MITLVLLHLLRLFPFFVAVHIEEIHDADVLRQVAVLLERENALSFAKIQSGWKWLICG